MLPLKRPTVARASCVAEDISNNGHITRSIDGMLSLVPPRTSYQTYKPTSVCASTYFTSRSSLPCFLIALGGTLGVSHLVSVTAPLRFWLRTRVNRVATASSVTSSLSTTTPSSASWFVVSSVYPHPAFSPLFYPPVLVLLASSQFKLCGVHSHRRLTIMPDAA
jgi:hypothetical protein